VGRSLAIAEFTALENVFLLSLFARISRDYKTKKMLSTESIKADFVASFSFNIQGHIGRRISDIVLSIFSNKP
jgi:hypothetical protein